MYFIIFNNITFLLNQFFLLYEKKMIKKIQVQLYIKKGTLYQTRKPE
jgi:hypothetical protein